MTDTSITTPTAPSGVGQPRDITPARGTPSTPAYKPVTPIPPTPATAALVRNPKNFTEFTDAQLVAQAEVMVEKKFLTREQANERLANSGVAPLPEPAPPNSDLPDLFPPATAGQYQMPQWVEKGDYTPQHHAADLQLRGWLAEAQLSKEHGSAVAADAAKVGRQYGKMNAAQREQFRQAERRRLDLMWGETTEDKIGLANRLVRTIEAKRPGFNAFLRDTGAAYSAFTIMTLVQQAERNAARKAKS